MEDERGNKNCFGLTFYREERVPLSITPSNAVNLLMEIPQKFQRVGEVEGVAIFLEILDPSPPKR